MADWIYDRDGQATLIPAPATRPVPALVWKSVLVRPKPGEALVLPAW
jgi:hypothetical protein